MIFCNPATYSGNCSGRTAASSMPVTGFASPEQPVSRESPALRNDQTRSASAAVLIMVVRRPNLRFAKVNKRALTSSKNSTTKTDWQGL